MAMAIVTHRQQQHSSGTRATTITTMAVAKYKVRISNSNNNNTVTDAHKSNYMLNAIPIHQLNHSITQTCRQWRERQDGMMLAMILTAGVVLTVVFIEEVLMLLMLIEDPPATFLPPTQVRTTNQSHQLQLERNPTTAITK